MTTQRRHPKVVPVDRRWVSWESCGAYPNAPPIRTLWHLVKRVGKKSCLTLCGRLSGINVRPNENPPDNLCSICVAKASSD